MSAPLNQNTQDAKNAQDVQNAREKSIKDKLDKLALTQKKNASSAASYIGKTLEKIPGGYNNKRYADKIKGASDEDLMKLAASSRQNQKSILAANEKGRLAKMGESFKRMTPTSAAKGLSEGAKGAAKGAKGAFNYVGRKAPDALMASIVIPNLLVAIGGPIALFVGAAAVLSYGVYKAGNAINHAYARYSSDTTNLDAPEMVEKSFNEAFGETFGFGKGKNQPETQPGPGPDDGDNAPDIVEVTASPSAPSA